MIKLKNKKAVVGSTTDWMAVTFIIFLIMVVYVAFCGVIYLDKGTASTVASIGDNSPSSTGLAMGGFLDYLQIQDKAGIKGIEKIRGGDINFLKEVMGDSIRDPGGLESFKKMIGADCYWVRIFYDKGIINHASAGSFGFDEFAENISVLTDKVGILTIKFYGGYCSNKK